MSKITKILKFLPPEVAHHVALGSLNLIYKLGLSSLFFKEPKKEKHNFLNLKFKNKLGIAAGLDKNGDYFNALGSLGFGFIEIGTVTPLPQPGNSRPRIFRFFSEGAIVNRLGFNNKGLQHMIKNLEKRKYDGVLGINIGANKNSEGNKRVNDYIDCFCALHKYADYITINISSPNTPNLRDFHNKDNLEFLLQSINEEKLKLGYKKPIFLKISPDEDNELILNVVSLVKKYNFDALSATNTTTDKSLLKNNPDLDGGLSGKPLFKKSNELIMYIKSIDPEINIVGVGGIFNKDDFQEKLRAGAALAQIYTSFIIDGPSVINKILD